MDYREEIYVNGRLVGYRVVDDPYAPVVEPEVPMVNTMTRGTFIDRFPMEKHALLLQLAKDDPTLAMAKHSLDIRDYVDVANPKTIAMIDYMVLTDLLTQPEAEVILAPIAANELGAIV